jgi:hypothetical protein
MAKSLQKEIEGYKNMMENAETAPGLESYNLWMAFKPGVLLYCREDGTDVVYRMRSMRRTTSTLISGHIKSYWNIICEKIQSQGMRFGYTDEWNMIGHFDGYRPLSELELYPLEYHPEKDRIWSELVARGKKYTSFTGVHYKFYDGVARLLPRDLLPEDSDDINEYRSHSVRYF